MVFVEQSICGTSCSACGFRASCRGCAATCGRPFGGACIAAEYIRAGGKEHYADFKQKLLSEVNTLLNANEIPEAARIFEAAGADLIDISGGLCGSIIKGNSQPGWFSELSVPARNSVSVPVLLTGGITTGQQAEELLRNGAADLIGVGRAMIGEADWSVRALKSLEKDGGNPGES